MQLQRYIMNGYVMIYKPQHPRAMINHYVYQHILVAQKILGRSLLKGQVVHHLDKVRSNNSQSNLIVLSNQQHSRLHRLLQQHKPRSQKIKIQIKNVYKTIKILQDKKKINKCFVCDTNTANIKYCSVKCMYKDRSSKLQPTIQQLKEDLKNMSYWQTGTKYGVTNNAVKKWAIKYGIYVKKFDRKPNKVPPLLPSSPGVISVAECSRDMAETSVRFRPPDQKIYGPVV